MNELLLFWSVLNGLDLHSAWPCKYTIVDSAYLFSLVVFMCQFDCITLGLICTVTIHAAGAGKFGFVCVCPGRLFAKHLSPCITLKVRQFWPSSQSAANSLRLNWLHMSMTQKSVARFF